ncbi:MAG: ornithine cyclodeaminase, partial [Methylococcaceae bacterium]|nr:ornithine cyclodeaminase [Methylococcaceae bacterium]
MVVSSEHEITLFDSVGFALEDFAILRLIYDLAGELGLGSEIDLIP